MMIDSATYIQTLAEKSDLGLLTFQQADKVLDYTKTAVTGQSNSSGVAAYPQSSKETLQPLVTLNKL